MQLGPPQIIACPHCQGLEKYKTLRSCNTYGARSWTDGKFVAPGMPVPPAVVRCSRCGRCYWLMDAREAGTDDPSVPLEWLRQVMKAPPEEVSRLLDEQDRLRIEAENAGAPRFVVEPAEEEYYHALESGLATDSKREKKLRILAWW